MPGYRRQQKSVASRLALAALATLTAPLASRALTINTTFDSSVTSNPNSAQIQNAFNSTALQFQNLFSDPITLNITVVAAPGTSILGQSNTTIWGIDTYSDIRNALIADSTSADDAIAV